MTHTRTFLRKGEHGQFLSVAIAAVFSLLVIFCFRTPPAHAFTCTFASVSTSTWNSAANWSCGAVPSSTTDVVIPASTSTLIVSNALAGTLSVGAGSILNVATSSLGITASTTNSGTITQSSSGFVTFGASTTNSGTGTLFVAGQMTLNGGRLTNSGTIGGAGSLIIAENWTNLGTGFTFTGAVVFNGSATGTFSNNAGITFSSLQVSKDAGYTITFASNATTTGNVSLTSGTWNVGDTTQFVGGNYSNDGGTLVATSLGIFTFNGSGAQTIANETGFNIVRINKSAGTASLAGNISTLAIALQAGTFSLGSKTLTITGNGGTNPFTISSGTFDPSTGTVVYNNTVATVTQVLSANFYNLQLIGTQPTQYNIASTSTVLGTLTIGTNSALDLAASATATVRGTITNSGYILLGSGAAIVHPAESVKITDSSGTETSPFANAASTYVTIQDSNLNLSSTTTESLVVNLTTSAGDSEPITLTETGAATGIFRNTSGLQYLAESPTVSNGILEVTTAGGTATVSYQDALDSSDTASDSATLTAPAAITASVGGGGGGGLPPVVTSYDSHTSTPAGTLPSGVIVNMLVKLPDDGKASTQEDSAVYYIGTDRMRHAFPNSKVYFTWYADFSGVQLVSADQLASIPLGKNVTYKPGKKMVKFTTDPKVYVVTKGGTLRGITSEAAATELYGATWNKMIDDISDAFYTNYTFGLSVAGKADFDPAAAEASVVYPSDSLAK